MSLRVPRPRYADVAATLALLFALGGTAYAVTALPKHSVGTSQLKPLAVTTAKLVDGSVTEPKLGDGSVTNAKLGDGSVTNFKLGDGSVTSTKLGDGSVTSTKLGDGSVTNFKLGSGVVTHSKLGASSIDGSNIAAESVSLADLVGADRQGAISFSLAANTCGTLNFSVSGAQVGQAAFVTFTTGTLPPKVVFGPMQITSAGHMQSVDCNQGSTTVSVSNLGVRVITFG